MSALGAETIDNLARVHPGVWLQRYGVILDKNRELITPTINIFQARAIAAYCFCVANQRAVRLIGLKPRQVGGTTIFAGLSYHHGRRFNCRGISIADTYPKSQNLFRIMRCYLENDAFDWGFGYDDPTGNLMRLHNGTEFEKRSADTPTSTRSDTLQIAHCSETAYWKDTPVKSAKAVAVAVLNALADHEATFGCSESTPAGAMGLFYDQWSAAYWPTFDYYWKSYSTQPDTADNGWIRIFAGWHEFTEHRESVRRRAPLSVRETEVIMNSLDLDEEDGIRRFAWDADQIAWRRWAILHKCLGDVNRFKEEYPCDPESCFLASGSARFDTAGLSALLIRSRAVESEFGLLQRHTDRVMFQATAERQAQFRFWEQPKIGCRYLISVDTMAGESDAMRGDPETLDAHSILCWRDEYRDSEGVMHEPRLVARVVAPCRYDNKPVSELIALLCEYYGRCTVIPETNNGFGLLNPLKELRVPLFRLAAYDKAKQKLVSTLGWNTSEDRRKDVIDALASRIREQSIDIGCPHVVSELQSFIRVSNGRSEAITGRHDDDVLSAAIAVFNLKSATEMVEDVVERRLPEDYAAWHTV